MCDMVVCLSWVGVELVMVLLIEVRAGVDKRTGGARQADFQGNPPVRLP